jgi:hypothetical protein
MKVKITTLQGIRLMKRCEKTKVGGNRFNSPWQYFVNGKEVVMWEYSKTDGEFYEEIITIKAFVKEIDTLTGKVK